MEPFVLAHWARPLNPNGDCSADGKLSLRPTLTLSDELPSSQILTFETCRRTLWLGFGGPDVFRSAFLGSPSLAELQIYEGASAYRFLLEVICGLHSPIFGETEIAGQFREFLNKYSRLDTAAMRLFRPWSLFLTEDLKHVRRSHLQGIGQQSYGSIVRKWTKTTEQVFVLGTGQLAQEIAPWLPNNTFFVSKNPESAKQRWSQSLSVPSSQICGREALSRIESTTSVVIAAPWTCAELEELQSELTNLGVREINWVDLRADRGSFKTQNNLDKLFTEQDSGRQLKDDTERLLKNELLRLSLKRWNHVHHRPYGWEDLTS